MSIRRPGWTRVGFRRVGARDAVATGVQSVTGTPPINVDNTDPANPIVGLGTTAGVPLSRFVLDLDALVAGSVTVNGSNQVTAIADQSGKGNNATETETFPAPPKWPLYDPGGINGLPSWIITDDETHGIGLDGIPVPRWIASSQNWFFAAVVQFESSAGGVIFVPGFDGISLPRASLAALVQGTQQMAASSTTGGFTAVPFTDGIVDYTGKPLVVFFNCVGDVVTVYINGGQRPIGAFVGTNILAGRSYCMGTAGGAGARTRIGRAIFGDGAATDDERNAIVGYLAQQWLIPLIPYAPGFVSTIPAGPTALGSAGTATTALRSDSTRPAYRSDLPLSTSWFIDPVNGVETAAGTTRATAIKSLAELSRRWWGARFTASTTVTVLGNIPSTDINSWNFTVDPAVEIKFIGSIGPTTGFGGAAIDNTLYSGSVTAYTNAGLAPAADDIELNDAAIPVSYTASGLLASGIIFKRTNSTALYFWGLKDLGGKTLRITTPQPGNPDTIGARNANPLSAADTYSAYALWTFPAQQWGQGGLGVEVSNSNGIGSTIRYELLNENTQWATNIGVTDVPVRRYRTWVGAAMTIVTVGVDNRNCLFEGSKTLNPVGWANTAIRGGGARGTGASLFSVAAFNQCSLSGTFESQGTILSATSLGAWFVNGITFAVHDVTSQSMIRVASGGRFVFGEAGGPAGHGVAGKGNTVKILMVSDDSTWELCNLNADWANPPFNAATTTDASPLQIGANSYVLGILPTVSLDGVRVSAVNFEINLRCTWTAKFSGKLINAGGGAATTFANDVGNAQTANVAVAQQYPTTARPVLKLRLVAPAGTPADSGLTATVYKNGGATTMTCTVAANLPAGSAASDVAAAHAIPYADGDTYDVLLSGTSASDVPFTVVIEGS